MTTETTSTKLSAANCTICLQAMHKEASISGCVHTFCFECIEEWAKNTNTCPMCKCEFNKIKEKQNAAHVKKVKRKVQIAEYDEEELERLDIEYEDYGDDDEDDNDDDDEDNEIRGYSSRDGFVVTDDTIEYEDDDDDDDDDEEEAETEDERDDESVASGTETDDEEEEEDDDDDDEVEIVRFVVDGFEMPKSSIYKRRRSEEESVVETRKSKRIALLSN